MTFQSLFTDHPKSVGESYPRHLGHALSFSVALFGAGLACFAHALVPGLCGTTASRAVTRLHARMVVNRAGA